ncbi:uncharacterized protein LOC111696973 [Eurytemora carolleeae]|uniref:uncharacterized protein LOC111696973 n=1 Tax=Eurytemora carolleeae TaxID=1294199 RepID=UPI000C788813|nr:uncharacterized protein LOC111696973 [Eurytemora carolleeae]|eukprot:XP_023322587.1 uncharacterized protein LOC111696973 [Eurytemora affinis]
MQNLIFVCVLVLVGSTLSSADLDQDWGREKRMYSHRSFNPVRRIRGTRRDDPARESRIVNIPPLRRLQSPQVAEVPQIYREDIILPPLQASRDISLPGVQSAHALQVSRQGHPQAVNFKTLADRQEERMSRAELLNLLEKAVKMRGTSMNNPSRALRYGFF